MLAILAALLALLNLGQFTNSILSPRLDLQGSVRNTLDTVVKDVRQSASYEIADVATNNPSATHIKFRKVDSWDPATNLFIFFPDFIDYSYDTVEKKLTRSIINSAGTVIAAREFYNINGAPFYSVDPASGALLPLDPNVLRSTGKLVVIINGEKQILGSTNINFSLQQEIKIRNGE